VGSVAGPGERNPSLPGWTRLGNRFINNPLTIEGRDSFRTTGIRHSPKRILCIFGNDRVREEDWQPPGQSPRTESRLPPLRCGASSATMMSSYLFALGLFYLCFASQALLAEDPLARPT
jgi:hypothetical protein